MMTDEIVNKVMRLVMQGLEEHDDQDLTDCVSLESFTSALRDRLNDYVILAKKDFHLSQPNPPEIPDSSAQPQPVAQGEAVATREIAFGWRPLMSWALGTIDELNEGPMTADQWGEDAGLYQSARGLLEVTPTIPTGYRVVPVEPTVAMNSNGAESLHESEMGGVSFDSSAALAYKAMIAASPSAGGV